MKKALTDHPKTKKPRTLEAQWRSLAGGACSFIHTCSCLRCYVPAMPAPWAAKSLTVSQLRLYPIHSCESVSLIYEHAGCRPLNEFG